MITVNKNRLANTFKTLCEIDSPSKSEGKIASFLTGVFQQFDAKTIITDNSSTKTGSDTGNLIIHFEGNTDKEGIFFACHMDTVEPGNNVEVVQNNNIFTSRGDTILGGDDKSGIASLIELIHLLTENKIDFGPIDLIFTTCEEIGLLGAQNLDKDLITAKYGYALDSTGINKIIIGAPETNRIKATYTGLSAHAGLNPEDGISAIKLAAQAICDLPQGRLDHETTANFGLINGGTATNIVPDKTTVEGEIRSHCRQKLAIQTKKTEEIFNNSVKSWRKTDNCKIKPSVQIEIWQEYPLMKLTEDSRVIQRLKCAEKITGKKLEFIKAGGGSDANIFNSYGLETAIIATGMDKVHTVDEQIDLNDLVTLTELLYAITTLPGSPSVTTPISINSK